MDSNILTTPIYQIQEHLNLIIEEYPKKLLYSLIQTEKNINMPKIKEDYIFVFMHIRGIFTNLAYESNSFLQEELKKSYDKKYIENFNRLLEYVQIE